MGFRWMPMILLLSSCAVIAWQNVNASDLTKQIYPLPKPPYSKEFMKGFCWALNIEASYNSHYYIYPEITVSDGKSEIVCDYIKPEDL